MHWNVILCFTFKCIGRHLFCVEIFIQLLFIHFTIVNKQMVKAALWPVRKIGVTAARRRGNCTRIVDGKAKKVKPKCPVKGTLWKHYNPTMPCNMAIYIIICCTMKEKYLVCIKLCLHNNFILKMEKFFLCIFKDFYIQMTTLSKWSLFTQISESV